MVCTACPAETPTQGADGISCVAKCPVGQWYKEAAGDDAAGCVPSSPGHFAKRIIVDGAGGEVNMGAVVEEACVPGTFSNGGVGACDKCPRGTHAAVDGGINLCVDAPAGSSAPTEGLLAPIPCDPGFFAEVAGLANCVACPEGKFQPDSGSSSCNVCPAGYYNARTGAVACVMCPKGEFSAETSQARCTKCEIGAFTDVQGSTSCTSCADAGTAAGENLGKLTTKESGTDARDKCVCQKAFHRLTTGEGAAITFACAPCDEGLFCPIGADAQTNLGTWMKVRPGFFVDGGKFDEVYQCDLLVMTGKRGSHEYPEGYVTDDSTAAQRCLGPKGTECGSNRTGVLCGKCKDGFFKADRGRCKSCAGEGGGTGPAVVLIVALVAILPFIGHKLLNANAMEQSGILMTQMALGILLTTTQLATVITKLSLEWPQWVEEFFDILSALGLNFEVLPFACAAGNDSGISRYASQMIVVPVVFGWFFLASILSQAAFKKGSALRIEHTDALNIFGQAYQSLFVLIVVWVIAPFRTFGHPSPALSEVQHVVKFPDTERGTTEHSTMVALAVFAFLGYALSFFAFYVYQIITMPTRARKSEAERMKILRGLRFIFLRFRPEAWYWGGVLLMRNFLCASIPLLPPEATFEQLILMFIILQVYLVAQVRRWPWHSSELNIVDTMQSVSILGMVASSFPFSGEPGKTSTQDTAATAMIAFYALGMVFVFSWITWGLFNYALASRSTAKVKSEMNMVIGCLAELQQISMCVQKANDGELYQALKDMDIDDIQMTRDVCAALEISLRQKLPDIMAQVEAGSGKLAKKTNRKKRLSVFERGITSPGRAMHIHKKMHGDSSGNFAEPAGGKAGDNEQEV